MCRKRIAFATSSVIFVARCHPAHQLTSIWRAELRREYCRCEESVRRCNAHCRAVPYLTYPCTTPMFGGIDRGRAMPILSRPEFVNEDAAYAPLEARICRRFQAKSRLNRLIAFTLQRRRAQRSLRCRGSIGRYLTMLARCSVLKGFH